MKDDFFTPIENTKPYFKAAFEGFAGSGKTFTASQVAIGLHKKLGSKLPVVIFDTEKAAKFLKPLFKEANIEVLVRESRSLADLKETMTRCRGGISDILIIDSISHVWEEFLKAYQEKTRRTFLQFQDWGILKPTWKSEFADPFVNDPYNIIMNGRAGYEYSNEMNEDTGKREIYKSGVKMKVEGETAYEPDMLVLMERFEQVVGGKEKRVWREATVLKDRSNLIDGKTFQNPSFVNFEPAIDFMLENPVSPNALTMPEGDTRLLFKTEEDKINWRKDRDKWVEELEGLLTRIAPGAVGKDKQLKLELLDIAFGTTSMTAITSLKPEEIKAGYIKIGEKAVEMGVAEVIEIDGRKRLQAKAPEAKKPAAKKE